MRIYAIVDTKSKDYSTIKQCLDGLKDQMGISVFWSIEYRDLSTLPWVPYNSSTDMGVSFPKISLDTEYLFNTLGYQYDCVVYFIDEANWKAGAGIKGWNLGQFFNNYQVQLIATNNNLGEMQYRINEEIAHSIDDFAFRELGRNLNAELGLDYDEDIVHDRNNPAGVRGNYKEFYAANRQLLIDIVTTRQKKALASLYSKLLVILRDMLLKLKQPKSI